MFPFILPLKDEQLIARVTKKETPRSTPTETVNHGFESCRPSYKNLHETSFRWFL